MCSKNRRDSQKWNTRLRSWRIGYILIFKVTSLKELSVVMGIVNHFATTPSLTDARSLMPAKDELTYQLFGSCGPKFTS